MTGDMDVVGGAAIALAFAERRSTRDVDAVFEPLARHLGLSTADEVLAVAERRLGDRLDAAARFFVEELFASG